MVSHTNAYFICEEHGNVYKLPDSTINSRMDVTRLEVLIEDVELPEGDEKVACPLCGGTFRIFFGN